MLSPVNRKKKPDLRPAMIGSERTPSSTRRLCALVSKQTAGRLPIIRSNSNISAQHYRCVRLGYGVDYASVTSQLILSDPALPTKNSAPTFDSVT